MLTFAKSGWRKNGAPYYCLVCDESLLEEIGHDPECPVPTIISVLSEAAPAAAAPRDALLASLRSVLAPVREVAAQSRIGLIGIMRDGPKGDGEPWLAFMRTQLIAALLNALPELLKIAGLSAESEGVEPDARKTKRVEAMCYEVAEDRQYPGMWRAEAIDQGGDAVFVVTFSGPQSESRAREYAAWKNEPDARKDRGRADDATGGM